MASYGNRRHLIFVMLMGTGSLAYSVPCTLVVGRGHSVTCTEDRWQPCSPAAARQNGLYEESAWFVALGSDTSCSDRDTGTNPLNRSPGYIPTNATQDAAKDLDKIGKIFQVQFAGADGLCRQITMQMGEQWGINAISGDPYGCMGRCGADCPGSLCSNYARDCLKHDVCSFFFGSSGGALDANCGDEFKASMGDYLSDCVIGHLCEVNDAFGLPDS